MKPVIERAQEALAALYCSRKKRFEGSDVVAKHIRAARDEALEEAIEGMKRIGVSPMAEQTIRRLKDEP